MSHLQIPDKQISLNPRELQLLRDLLDEAEKAARRSLRAAGRWTERLEQHVELLADISEKLGSQSAPLCLWATGAW